MIGLAYLVAGAIYLVAMVSLVGWAWRKGRKLNRGAALAYATLAFLSLYLPVFWDFIPTIVAHRQLCAKDAGIVISKDPKQWVSEHAEEADALRISFWDPNKPKSIELGVGWQRSFINRRVAEDDRRTKISGAPWINVVRYERRIFDTTTNQTLMQVVDYRAGATLVSQTLRPQPDARSCSPRNFVGEYLDAIRPLYLEGPIQ